MARSSPKEYGIVNGTSEKTAIFFKYGESKEANRLINSDAELSVINSLAKARGQEVVFFAGLINLEMEDGSIMEADGIQQGNRIFVQIDSNTHSARGIYDHEDTHVVIEANGGQHGELFKSLSAQLKNLLADKYGETYEKYRTALPASYTELDILEEMLCDADGRMNSMTDTAELSDTVKKAVYENRKNRGTSEEGRQSKASFAGRQSKTANTGQLTQAEQMEQQNIDAETIRQETGWFRGADGEWRYEIDDSRARVNLKGDARFRQEHPGYARYMELMDTMLYGELTNDEFKELRALDREWSDVSKKLSASVRDGEARLGDVMEHDGLYEAYPDIAEIRVSFEKMEAGNRGAYIPSQNRIVLNEELKNDPDALMNSLLHEVQHVIQQKEGFAEGASPEYWNREETYNRAMEKWQDEHGKIFYHLSAEDKALYREYREISAKEDEFFANPTPEAMEEMDALEERSDELYRELYGKGWFGKLNRLDRLMSDMEQAVKSMYWSTAGEIEARDSANRRRMTDEERKNSPPDTGDELTVFAENGEKSDLIAESFPDKFQKWLKEGRPDNKPLYVGRTSTALKSIGVDDKEIYWDPSKIRKTQRDHPEMSDDVLAQVPYIIEKPIVVMESKTQPNRLTILSEVTATNGIPVMAVMELLPKGRKTMELNQLKVVNSYTLLSDKEKAEGTASITKTQEMINTSRILYVEPDIERTESWLSLNQLQLPLGITNFGSLGTVTLVHRDVNGRFSAETKENAEPEWKQKLRGADFSASSIGVDTDNPIYRAGMEEARRAEAQPLQDTGITDNRFTEALKKIGVNNITGSLVDYAGIEVEQQTARTAAEARRYLRRVLRETRADPRTQAFAHDVARGIYTMDDLPNTMSRGIVEELADAYRFAEGVVQDSLAYKRRQINAGLDADARKLFADSDNYNPAKFGRLSKTLMNERTPARVLRSIFGEQKGSEIYEAYWRPIIENNAAAKLWKNKQREDVRTFRDSKGTKKEERPLLFLMFGGKNWG